MKNYAPYLKIYFSQMSHRRFLLLLLLMISISSLIRVYYGIRFNFFVLDSDATIITKTIESIYISQSIHPDVGFIYNNGFGYQLYATIGSLVIGIPVIDYQMYIRPMLGTITIIISYLFFSVFIKSKNIIILLMSLFLVSPITLFEVTRSSHMFITLSAMLMLFYFIMHIFNRKRNQYLLLFIPVLICLCITNIFFALIINSGLILAILIQTYRPTFTCNKIFKNICILKNFTIIFIIIIFQLAISIYIYDQMLHGSIYLLETVLSVTEKITTPITPTTYTYVAVAWKSAYIYWMLIVLFNITILPLSLLCFAQIIYLYIMKKIIISIEGMIALATFGLWGIFVIISIMTDYIGAGGLAANLQMRITTLIIPFSLLMIGFFIINNVDNVVTKLFCSRYMTIVFIIFLIGSLLYITADPLVSNRWGFSNNYEKNSIFWLDDNVENQATVWEGDAFVTGSRLNEVYSRYLPIYSIKKLRFVSLLHTPEYFPSSEIIIDHYNDIRLDLPIFALENLVYSNGEANIFHSQSFSP